MNTSGLVETQRFASPSGLLTLLVQREIYPDFVDTSISFDGFVWHTHADMLAAWFTCSDGEAVDRLLEGIFSNKYRIWLEYVDDTILDAGIEIDQETAAGEQDSTVQWRHWSDL